MINIRLRQPARAVADYDASLAVRDSGLARYGRGIAKQMLGDEGGAEADIAEALKLSPAAADSYREMGLAP